MKKLILLSFLIGCGECPTYGHLWSCFKDMHVKQADENKDGVTTEEEMNSFKKQWLKRNEFILNENTTCIHDKDGNLLDSDEVYFMFPQCFKGKNPPVCGCSAE